MKLSAEICETTREGGFFAFQPSHEDGIADWHDLDRHRVFRVVHVVNDDEDEFHFVDDHGRAFFLRPLTLASYRKLRGQLVEAPDFDSLADLEKAIRARVAGK